MTSISRATWCGPASRVVWQAKAVNTVLYADAWDLILVEGLGESLECVSSERLSKEVSFLNRINRLFAATLSLRRVTFWQSAGSKEVNEQAHCRCGNADTGGVHH
jgi:hypothetical protein